MTQHGRARPFSVALYLLTVFALSWPLQFAFLMLGDAFRPILLVSMIMAGAGTFVAGRYIFRDGFEITIADTVGIEYTSRSHMQSVVGLATRMRTPIGTLTRLSHPRPKVRDSARASTEVD
jgi:hypothetical protein